MPPPHGLVHWGQQGEKRIVRISTRVQRSTSLAITGNQNHPSGPTNNITPNHNTDSGIQNFQVSRNNATLTLLSFLPLPSCHRSTVDTGPTHRTAARWADCDPRSCWQGNRSHPGTLRPAAGNLLRMCWSTVDTENGRPHGQTLVKPRVATQARPHSSIFVGTFFDTPTYTNHPN